MNLLAAGAIVAFVTLAATGWVLVRDHIEHPIKLERVLLAGAVFILNISVLVGLIGLIANRNELRDKLSASDAITACRNRIAARQSDAQTDYLLDIGSIVLAPQTERGTLAAEARADGTTLAQARDLRKHFEEDPSRPCPIP